MCEPLKLTLACIGGLACGYGIGVLLYGLYVIARVAYYIGAF